ncbi:MAG: DNA cytosine methyltransferase, partial [Bdellovibrionota bacterium]
MRIAEFYAGIGGLSAALPSGLPAAVVVLAAEQSREALDTYQRNFPGTRSLKINLEHLTVKQLTELGADTWWLSPPCQPYTVKGIGRDLDDPRAASLRRLMSLLSESGTAMRPENIWLENVLGFRGSRAQTELFRLLTELGYSVRETAVCPTKIGIPTRRPRYYLAASRRMPPGLPEWPCAEARTKRELNEFVIPACDQDPSLYLSSDVLARFGPGLRILDRNDPAAYTTCFTSSYGGALMRSGSYLRTGQGTGVRRFAPEEILRLLQFPPDFEF